MPCWLRSLGMSRTFIGVPNCSRFDTAVYGLPNVSYPLFLPLSHSASGKQAAIYISTTAISNFLTSRFAPVFTFETISPWLCSPSRHVTVAMRCFAGYKAFCHSTDTHVIAQSMDCSSQHDLLTCLWISHQVGMFNLERRS